MNAVIIRFINTTLVHHRTVSAYKIRGSRKVVINVLMMNFTTSTIFFTTTFFTTGGLPSLSTLSSTLTNLVIIK